MKKVVIIFVLTFLLQASAMQPIDSESNETQGYDTTPSSTPTFFDKKFQEFKSWLSKDSEKTENKTFKLKSVERPIFGERSLNIFEAIDRNPDRAIKDAQKLKFSFKENELSKPSSKPVTIISTKLFTQAEFDQILKQDYPKTLGETLKFYKNWQEMSKDTQKLQTMSFVLRELSKYPRLKREFQEKLSLYIQEHGRTDDLTAILSEYKKKILAQSNVS